jgi:hypothetical protein
MNTEARTDTRPRCTRMADIHSLDGEPVSLIGKYHATSLTQGLKSRDADADHAVIQMEDGVQVLLEPNWSPASRRDRSERDQFDNRQVSVEGTIHSSCPEASESLASIIGPCITSVQRIRQLSKEGES